VVDAVAVVEIAGFTRLGGRKQARENFRYQGFQRTNTSTDNSRVQLDTRPDGNTDMVPCRVRGYSRDVE